MTEIEAMLGLILAVAVVGAAARRLPVPLPILLIVAGVGLSFVAPFDAFQLDPAIFFLVFIPPLLFADGWQFPKREFVSLRYSILLLAFGLVFATTAVVGYVVHWMIPSIPLAAAFALGAVISPTDAVAVAEVTQKLRLPSRLTAVLNGESLINDASGLVAFKLAIAAVVTGTFSFGAAAAELAWLALGGSAAGLAVAGAIQWIRLQLTRRGMEEPAVQVTLSLLTPFAAYLAAESLRVSGILAVVAAGLYAGIHDMRHLTLETRLKAWSVWEMVLYLLNGLVFLVLGLQLRGVLGGIEGHSWTELAGYVVVVSAAVILVRLAWIFPGSRVALWLTRLHRPDFPAAPWRDVFVAGWAGIRGAVTLAAALSIPAMAGAEPFPERELLIFLAASVIVVTLALNGLTLPLMIRWFRVTDDGRIQREECAARVTTAHAAVHALRERLDHQQDAADREFTLALVREYERHARHVAAGGLADTSAETSRISAERGLRLHALAAERAALHELHESRRINEQAMFVIQRELDLREASLSAAGRGAARE